MILWMIADDELEQTATIKKYLIVQQEGSRAVSRTVGHHRKQKELAMNEASLKNTLCTELSWSHYRSLMRIENKECRTWYTKECAGSNWSVRRLDCQINTMFYERLLASQDIAAHLLCFLLFCVGACALPFVCSCSETFNLSERYASYVQN